MMNTPAKTPWLQVAYAALLAVWLGSLLTVGGLVVPTLFANLEKTQAADIAVVLFRLQGLLGFVILALALLMLLTRRLVDLRGETAWLLLALLAGIVLQFWIIPELLAQRFSTAKVPLWHIASTALFALQSLCAAVLFIRRLR